MTQYLKTLGSISRTLGMNATETVICRQLLIRCSSRQKIGGFYDPKTLQIGEFKGPKVYWPDWKILGS